MTIYLLVIEMLHSNTRRADEGSVRVVKTLEQITGFHCHIALRYDLKTQFAYRWTIMFPEILVTFVFPYSTKPNVSFVLIASLTQKTYYRFLCKYGFAESCGRSYHLYI